MWWSVDEDLLLLTAGYYNGNMVEWLEHVCDSSGGGCKTYHNCHQQQFSCLVALLVIEQMKTKSSGGRTWGCANGSL